MKRKIFILVSFVSFAFLQNTGDEKNDNEIKIVSNNQNEVIKVYEGFGGGIGGNVGNQFYTYDGPGLFGYNNTTTVVFTAKYKTKENGDSYPLIGCKAVLAKVNNGGINYDCLSNDDILSTTYSDNNGIVKFQINKSISSSGTNAVVCVYPDNGNVSIYSNLPLMDQYNFTQQVGSSNWGKKIIARYNLGTIYKPILVSYLPFTVKDGDYNIIDDITIDAHNPADHWSRCFYVGQSAMRAGEFTNQMFGYQPSPINIFYENCEYSYYNSVFEEIHIKEEESSSDFNAVMHEYGHYVQDIKDILPFLPLTNKHSIEESTLNYTSNMDKARKLAWKEGWANAFAKVVQRYSKQVGKAPADSAFGGTEFLDYCLDTSIITTNGNADTYELVVASCLWDLIDNEGIEGSLVDDETISLSYKKWFELVTNGDVENLGDFVNYLKNNYLDYNLSYSDVIGLLDANGIN